MQTETGTDAEMVRAIAQDLMKWDTDKLPLWFWNPLESEAACAQVLDALAHRFGGFLNLAAIADGWTCFCCGERGYTGTCHEGITAESRRRAIVLCAYDVVRDGKGKGE